jgi:hypothetical protein
MPIMSVDALERLLTCLGHWLLFFTFLVVLGLVVEYIPEIIEKARTKQFPWKSVHTIIGGVLITAGVAGELYFEDRASKVETDLRMANDTITASLNKEAGEARKTAGEAGERTKQLEKDTVRLKGDLDKATADANRQAKELRQQNLATESRLTEANQKLEAERRTRLEIEKEISPRAVMVISKDGKMNIDPLKPFAGTQVILESIPDAEPRRAAETLGYAVQAAGWKIVPSAPSDKNINDGVLVELVGCRSVTTERVARWHMNRVF